MTKKRKKKEKQYRIQGLLKGHMITHFVFRCDEYPFKFFFNSPTIKKKTPNTEQMFIFTQDYVHVIFNLRVTRMPFVNLKEPSTEQHCTVKRYRTKHEHFKTVTNKKGEKESNSKEREKGKTS